MSEKYDIRDITLIPTLYTLCVCISVILCVYMYVYMLLYVWMCVEKVENSYSDIHYWIIYSSKKFCYLFIEKSRISRKRQIKNYTTCLFTLKYARYWDNFFHASTSTYLLGLLKFSLKSNNYKASFISNFIKLKKSIFKTTLYIVYERFPGYGATMAIHHLKLQKR